MGGKSIYRATNIETGEVIEGCASELSDRLGLKINNFYNYIERESKAKGVWVLDYAERPQSKQIDSHLTILLKEWDELTGPVRKYIIERNERRKANVEER